MTSVRRALWLCLLVTLGTHGHVLGQLPCTPFEPKLGCIDPTPDPANNGVKPFPCSDLILTSTNPMSLSECYELNLVGCPSVTGSTLKDIIVRIAVGEQTPGQVELGTIVLFSGLGGKQPWDEASSKTTLPVLPSTASVDTIGALHDAGYRTVQVLWDDTWWIVDPALKTWPPSVVIQEGLVRMACRPATILRWAYDTYVSCASCRPGRAFCATGNSAGASQMAYALSEYRQGDGPRPAQGGTRILDSVVFTSGPVFAEFDTACTDPPQDPAQINDFGFPDLSKGLLDMAFGAQKDLGPCSDPNGYVPSVACDPPPCAADNHALLAASSHDHDGPATVFTYDTRLSILNAPECLTNPISCDQGLVLPNQDPPVDRNFNSMLCILNGDCVVAGDEASGALASAEVYKGFVGITRQTTASQEHLLPARPAGAKAIRDELFAQCVALP